MIDNKGKIRCDCEIGSVKNGWHTCGRLAVVQAEKLIAGIISRTDYCSKHESHATKEGRILAKRYSCPGA